MRLERLQRNDLSDTAFDWLKRYIAAVDQRSTDAYSGLISDDCALQLNYVGPLLGRDAVLTMLGSYWESLASVEHEPLAILGDDHHFALETLHHYRARSGRKITIPATEIIEREADGLARRVRIYCDPSPVFSEEPA